MRSPDYSGGVKPFHETERRAFLQAVDISCYSLIALSRAFQKLLDPDASVVTISISTTQMASENYGFMAPIKAALDSSLAFLAKSFSTFSRVRFNAVAPGLLKTSASAGIPGYVDAYLYAEQVIPRKSAVTTEEVASAGGFSAQPTIERPQRPASGDRRRHVDQLLRPRPDPPCFASGMSEANGERGALAPCYSLPEQLPPHPRRRRPPLRSRAERGVKPTGGSRPPLAILRIMLA